METYREYTIRCKTCNEQIACFSTDYEALLEAGYSVEDALNELGITNYCSRAAMMNPTIVSFNMENREVIEGFKSVDAATEADAQNESTTRPVFVQCMTVQPTLALGIMGVQTVPKPAPILPGLAGIRPVTQPQAVQTAQAQPTQAIQLRIAPTLVLPTQARIGPAAPAQTIAFAQPVPRVLTTIQTVQAARPAQPLTTIQLARPAPPLTISPTIGTTPPGEAPIIPGITLPGEEPIVPPIIPGIELGDIEALGVGIPVKGLDVTELTKFQEPIAVGVPTINPDPTVPRARIYVGASKYVEVLNGRTYLAQ